MKIKTSLLSLLVVSLVIFGPTKSSSAIAQDKVPFARGAGEFVNTSPFRPGVYQFSFDAVGNKNGRAHGRAVFDNLTAQTHIEIRIEELPKGTAVAFGAVDDRDEPFLDIITPAFPAPEPGCGNFLFPLTFFQISGDAIQVEP